MVLWKQPFPCWTINPILWPLVKGYMPYWWKETYLPFLDFVEMEHPGLQMLTQGRITNWGEHQSFYLCNHRNLSWSGWGREGFWDNWTPMTWKFSSLLKSEYQPTLIECGGHTPELKSRNHGLAIIWMTAAKMRYFKLGTFWENPGHMTTTCISECSEPVYLRLEATTKDHASYKLILKPLSTL